MIHIGSVSIIFLQKRRGRNFCKSIATEMGGVSRDAFKSIRVSGRCSSPELSGLPIANAKSQRFSYAISQIAPPSPVALDRKSQLNTLHFGMQSIKSHWPLSFSTPKSQRFQSQRQDTNATKPQTLAFYKSQRFSAAKLLSLGDVR